MGINTIHNKINDVIEAFNLTKQQYFRCELLGSKDCRKIELVKGLAPYTITMTIKVNGNTEIEEEDKIRILGKVLKVNSLSETYDNPNQFRKRSDYFAFTGSTIIGLE